MLTDRRKRSKYLDRLNHFLRSGLKPNRIHISPPATLNTRLTGHGAYIIADSSDLDDTIADGAAAVQSMMTSTFGVIASFEPAGTLAAYRQESPSDVIWLY